MVAGMRIFLVLAIVASSTIVARAQQRVTPSGSADGKSTPYGIPEQIRDGINIVVTVEQGANGLDVRIDDLEFDVGKGAEAAGWTLNSSSNLVMTVNVVLLRKIGDDRYAFKLDVSAGKSLLRRNSDDDTSGTIGLIAASRTVEARKYQYGGLRTTARMLATRVGRELWQKIVQQSLDRQRGK